ncbi:MAG: biofilm-associated protein, partial [Nitrosopumilaceae archaeon]
MNISSMRGIFLSLIFIFSISLALIPNSVYGADEITVDSTSFEKSTIIEFTNNGKDEVKSLRIWLGSDYNFESFKSESGWTGEKTPQGVIIFTTANSLISKDSVKIGVTTDKAKPGINWKALDKNGKQIAIGKSVSKDLKDKVITSSKTDFSDGVKENSSFRIIPDKPNAGADIRVTGDNFGSSTNFEFFINSKKLGTFDTDGDGHFITTFQIPEKQESERVDFIVEDKNGAEKKISLRLGDEGTKIPESEYVQLTIKGIPEIMHRGDFLEISGTATPGSAVTASVKGPDGEVINTRT